MKQAILKELKFVLVLAVIGQLAFALISSDFTTPHYEGRIYATTGVKHKSEDLHKLNEAAHYFGQTMIGWLKFPGFMHNLEEAVSLPENSTISAHIQERQNIIFTVSSAEPIELDRLAEVKNFLQSKINEYNSVTQTEFVLTNLDYELAKLERSYAFGAIIALIISLVVSLGLLFIRKEFS